MELIHTVGKEEGEVYWVRDYKQLEHAALLRCFPPQPGMPKNYTWDQIRSQVRAFRTSNQAASSSLSFAVIKDFHIDARKQQIYFLANSYNCDGCLSRQLTLYQVSYLDNLNREETSSELCEQFITSKYSDSMLICTASS